MMAFVGQWSHAGAAILFGALSVWLAQRWFSTRQGVALLVASIFTTIWAIAFSLSGQHAFIAQVTEHLRNLAWLAFMYVLWRQGEGEKRSLSVMMLYAVIAAVVVVEMIMDLVPQFIAGSPRLMEAAFLAASVLHMMVAIGALVLVHNLYTAATHEARSAIRLPMVGIAALLIYDLNLYTVSYLTWSWSYELYQLRGILAALTAPIFALGAQRTQNWTVQLSRRMAFQSLSLFAIGGYLTVMVVITSALKFIGGDQARLAQITFVFGASIAALALLPSRQFRAWFRVKISKHLFQHRYDYRAEWLRFTDTLGRPGEGALPLEARIVQAVADITESPGGLLLVPDGSGTLVVQSRWNWKLIDPPAIAACADATSWFGSSGRVVELDALRQNDSADDERRYIPEWIIYEERAWAIVPLVHVDRLAGVVLLERPLIARTLDWEDFDLLRVVGRQVASYLAEAQGQEALSDAKRFDEFNRRFAFIMHDIKNLVSQLTLITRNAERHADNPEFRVDMIATLKSSVARMNDLLARLSQHNQGKVDDPRPVAIGAVAEAVASSKRHFHPVVIVGDQALLAVADPARLEQALGHLVQNAIDASPPTEPVTVSISPSDDDVRLEIRDQGCGMSSAFMRDKLFKPFASSKEGGFGIGAFEARALILTMGGRIDVTSREGEGSCFTILLPLARAMRSNSIETEALAA
jgi:putative PEP-CTERM system histidine kinase